MWKYKVRLISKFCRKVKITWFVIQTVLFLTVLSTSLCSESNESLNVENNEHITNTNYDIIPSSVWQRLVAIRDSIGAITGLDTLYEGRTHSNGMPYHIHIPENLSPDIKYPLVIFLHGYTDLTLDTHNGFPKGVWSLPMFQDIHPHILFVPRYRDNNDHWLNEDFRDIFIETLNDLISELNSNSEIPNIDTTRIYLTGFSQGGMGTWNYIMNFPYKFAAAAPLSGFYAGPQNYSQAEEIKHIPIWIFNGDSDDGVGGSRISYEMLNTVGASDVRYHEYENHGHVIDDFAYFTEGFLDWFFSQRLISTGIQDVSKSYPADIILFQNYPNPFNPVTTIDFTLQKSKQISLKIYDITGQEVTELINSIRSAGKHQVIWRANGLASGIYLAQLQTGSQIRTIKLVIQK